MPARLTPFLLGLLAAFVPAAATQSHHAAGGSPMRLAPGKPVTVESFWLEYHPLTPDGTFYTFRLEPDEELKFSWRLPEGFSLGEMRLPGLQEFETDHGAVNGHQPGTVLLQEILLPDRWQGGDVHIEVTMSYYVCLVTCQPIFEKGTFEAAADELEPKQ